MFRHARQLDLPRRLNHADRKGRILISLEASREILFVKEQPFRSPTDSSPPSLPFSYILYISTLLRIIDPTQQEKKSTSSDDFSLSLSFSLFFPLLYERRRSQRLRVEIVSSLLQLPSSGTLEFFPSFPPLEKGEVTTRRGVAGEGGGELLPS